MRGLERDATKPDVTRAVHVHWLQVVAAALCLVGPIAAASAILFHFASEIPILDDYREVFGFSLGWEQIHGLAAKLQFLAAFQHVEYKLVFEELLVAVELGLIHHISIRLLIALGNLFLSGIAWLLWVMYAEDSTSPYRQLLHFLPVISILFGLDYAETVDSAAVSLQVLTSIFFALATSLLLVRSVKFPNKTAGWAFWLACLLALVGCFASANSFLLGPVGLGLLLVRRAYRLFLPWCAIFILPGAVYWYHFQPFPHPPDGSLSVKVVFFINLLGNAAPAYKVVLPLGLAVLAIYCAAIRSSYGKRNPAAFLWGTLLVSNAALMALGRNGYGLEYSYTSRYRIYSNLLLIFCYGFVFEYLGDWVASAQSRRRIYLCALAASLLFCLRADVIGWNFLADRQHRLHIGLESYRAQPKLNSPLYLEHPEHDDGSLDEARTVTTQAIAMGIYSLPDPNSR